MMECEPPCIFQKETVMITSTAQLQSWGKSSLNLITFS